MSQRPKAVIIVSVYFQFAVIYLYKIYLTLKLFLGHIQRARKVVPVQNYGGVLPKEKKYKFLSDRINQTEDLKTPTTPGS